MLLSKLAERQPAVSGSISQISSFRLVQPLVQSALRGRAAQRRSRVQLVRAPRDLVLRCVLSPDAPAKGNTYISRSSDVILVGDIGGTNCRLNLWRPMEDGQFACLAEQKYPTKEYPDFPDALSAFLAQLPDHYQPGFAALAVAGPVRDQVCVMTNCPWVIDGPALTNNFGIQTAVLNDFEAVGYGITALAPSQLVPLNPNATPADKGPKLCIGPGTGLGVAQVVWDESLGRYRVLPSEGAHGTWGPRGDLERELQAWVEKKEGYCETEQVACGKGMLRIYQFLCEKEGVEGDASEPADVSFAARDGKPRALAAMDLFLRILGAEAGNKALMLLATGGVYLAGGITPKALQHMDESNIVDAFLYKGNPKFSQLLSTFPLYAVNTEELGLIGCRAYAVAATQAAR